MRTSKRDFFNFIAVVLLVFFLQISITSGLAKGNFAKVIVSGGGLISEIEITDPALLGFGSLMAIPNALNPAPQVTGEGYLITRYEQKSNGEYVAWDSLRYYPNTANGRGYVFYIGLVNGSSEYDGHWFYAVSSDEVLFQKIVHTQGTSSSEATATKSLLLLGLGLGLVATIAVVKYVLPKLHTS